MQENRKRQFIDPALPPTGKVPVAVLDGETADPCQRSHPRRGHPRPQPGRRDGLPVGQRHGYRRAETGDKKHIAPGPEIIREMFGREPNLILIDEVALSCLRADPLLGR